MGADAQLRLARSLMGGSPTTAVASDHGFGVQFLAIDASKVLVDLGLLSTPQTSNCRTAVVGRPSARPGVLGRWGGADLPQRRGPRPGRRRVHPDPAGERRCHRRLDQGRAPGAVRPERLERRRQPRGLAGHRSGLHQGRGPGHPQRPRLHGRHGLPDADRRPSRVLRDAVRVRRGDARHADRAVALLRPARVRARRPEPGRQHQHAGDVHPRRRRHPQRNRHRADDRHRSHPGLPHAGARAPQSQGRVLLETLPHRSSITPISIIGLNDFHGQLDPTTMLFDNINTLVGGASQLASMFDAEAASLPGPTYLLAAGDNVEPAPPTRACSRTSPRSTSRTRGASMRRRTATTNSTTGSRGSWTTRRGRTSRSSPRTSSTTRRAAAPRGSGRQSCSRSAA